MNERITQIVRGIDAVVPVLLALMMTGYCLVFALRTTSGVQWPYEWDAFRDIGTAQTMLDGRYPEDPILLGKTLWYNPLTAACNAAWSAMTGTPLPRANVVLGPWLQLLTPAGFFVLVWVLFGRWAAVLGLGAFLFGKTGNIPAWNCATYSPWLLAPVFAQGFFYLTLAGFVLVRRKRPESLLWHALVGLFLGLTFMTHTAPAVNAGGVMAVVVAAAAWSAWRGGARSQEAGERIQNPESRIQKEDCHAPCDVETRSISPSLATNCGTGNQESESRIQKGDEFVSRNGGIVAMGREAVLPFMVLLAVAFLTSLPYTWSILRDYQFRVLNPWPGLYASSYVDLSELPRRLREALNWKNLVALAGVGAVLARADWRRASPVPFLWLALAAVFLAENYLSQALQRRGVVMTTLVPGHHAAVYLSAAHWVFFGAGAAAFARLVAELLLRAAGYRGRTDESVSATLTNAACCTAVLAAVVAGMFAQRPYRDWPEMGITHNRAEYAAIHESKADMYSWILRNTRPDAVFLTEDDPVGLQVVMPAARKLAGAALLIYLNPYVDVQPLLNDQRQMLQAMRDGNAGQFYDAARRQSVTHYLGREKGADGAPAAAPRFFREAFRAGGLVVYEMEPPAVAGG